MATRTPTPEIRTNDVDLRELSIRDLLDLATPTTAAPKNVLNAVTLAICSMNEERVEMSEPDREYRITLLKTLRWQLGTELSKNKLNQHDPEYQNLESALLMVAAFLDGVEFGVGLGVGFGIDLVSRFAE